MSSGSLIALFSHPNFDASLLFAYLFKTFAKGSDSAGIREYLINRMFSLSDVDVERYVPQIVCLLCHRGGSRLSSLEKFVLHRCNRSMHVALKFFWYVQSYVEDEGANVSTTGSFVRLLRSNCEMALVNGSDTESHDDAMDKVARSDYFTRVTQFVDRLMRISNTLRAVAVGERAQQLRERLQSLVSLPVYVPLWPADSPHFSVASLVANECVVLNSRDRVPYMVFMEVLRSEVPCSDQPNVHKHAEGIQTIMEKMKRETIEKTTTTTTEADLQPSIADQKALEKWMEKSAVQKESDETNRHSESWSERKARLARESAFSEDPHWNVCSFIVKYGDDCRQELLAVQLLGAIQRIYERAHLPLWISPHHQVLVVGKHAAIVETIPNVKSIHQHKKPAVNGDASISALFRSWYGEPSSQQYELAQKNFVESLAGYSAACYLLQFKDRHNGNILIDNEGHIIHIDFGFMLGQSPGGISFERCHFKLVREWVELMGGEQSDLFQYFKALLIKGFLELCRHRDEIVVLAEMMLVEGKTKQPISCLQPGQSVIDSLRTRFDVLGKTEEQLMQDVSDMVSTCLDATSTNLYDRFQFATNNILF
jgi:hypothetical protein